jgi:hypothetical protein
MRLAQRLPFLPMLRRLPTLTLASVSLLMGCGTNVTPAGHDAYVGGETAALQCAPDLDGVLTAKELPTVFDTPVSYLENPAGKTRTVDVVGVTSKTGAITWDFGADYADDGVLSVTVTTLAGKWYAASFPTGQFVTPQDAAHTLEAIYRRDDAGVYLLGLASTAEKPGEGQTLIAYDVGIIVAKFPMTAGSSWVAKGNVINGKIRGLPYAGADTYEVSDDAVGRLILHDFTFDSVHRVRTKVTVSPSAGANLVTRQVSFFAECFGEIARAVSQNNEPNADFTTAAELRRLGK